MFSFEHKSTNFTNRYLHYKYFRWLLWTLDKLLFPCGQFSRSLSPFLLSCFFRSLTKRRVAGLRIASPLRAPCSTTSHACSKLDARFNRYSIVGFCCWCRCSFCLISPLKGFVRVLYFLKTLDSKSWKISSIQWVWYNVLFLKYKATKEQNQR